MPATLKPVSTQSKCAVTDGGIYETCLVDCDKVADIIFDENHCIVDFVMTEAGAWECYLFDDDDSGFYNQTGTRTNNKHTVTQQASFKYDGVSKDSINFANCIKDFCCLYAIHFWNNGIATVQGIDYNYDTGVWKKSKQRLKPTVSINSDTGANSDNTTVLLDSVGRCFSQPAIFTSSDEILAL